MDRRRTKDKEPAEIQGQHALPAKGKNERAYFVCDNAYTLTEMA